MGLFPLCRGEQVTKYQGTPLGNPNYRVYSHVVQMSSMCMLIIKTTSSQKLGRHASRHVRSVWKSLGRVSFGSKIFYRLSRWMKRFKKEKKNNIFCWPRTNRKSYPDPKLTNIRGPLSSTFHVPETLTEWKSESITWQLWNGIRYHSIGRSWIQILKYKDWESCCANYKMSTAVCVESPPCAQQLAFQLGGC